MNATLKFFEVRDRATYIAVFAISTPNAFEDDPQNVTLCVDGFIEQMAAEQYLAARAGFGPDQLYVILGRLEYPSECQYDPHAWNTGARTSPEAHKYIIKNWATLRSGDVIDVEHILNETTEPKVSERLTSRF